MTSYNKIVLAIPHSVRHVSSSWDDDVLLQTDADRWTDWYTDMLFAPKHNCEHISPIIGSISRFDCDLERLIDDPLESSGRGIIYQTSHSGAKKINSHITKERAIELWMGYRSQISNALVDKSLIIDCHSFPSDISDIDICIGYNDDDTKPPKDIINGIEDIFALRGYVVGHNNPYANSIAPNTSIAYNSVMIEINKKLYLDENTYKLKSCAYKLHYCLQDLYKLLLGL